MKPSLRVEHLALALQYWRKQRDWTQLELALRAKIAPSHVAGLEQGSRTNPTLSVMMALADALEITLNDLVALPPGVESHPPAKKRRNKK
jgi:transcriptional regulator with XRE-family HTH domain